MYFVQGTGLFGVRGARAPRHAVLEPGQDQGFAMAAQAVKDPGRCPHRAAITQYAQVSHAGRCKNIEIDKQANIKHK